MGYSVPVLGRVRFISTNILAYYPTGRGDVGDSTWRPQRDETQSLGEFEKVSYEMTRKIFLIPVHTSGTLDDDILGTRVEDNQVKTISARKADKEGHCADAIADALFSITLAVSFRRRQEPQSENVKKLVEILLHGRGESSLHGLILTADRCYGSTSMAQIFSKLGIGSMVIMPQYLLRCHPFVGRSFVSITRYDDDNIDEESSEEDDANSCEYQPPISSTSYFVMQNEDGSRTVSNNDRRRKFIIDDGPNTGPSVFISNKSLYLGGTGSGRAKTCAVAVREHGNQHFSNTVRFMYSVSTGITYNFDK